MSRKRLARVEDGMCPISGLEVPDTDGRVVSFSEQKGLVITRGMIKTGARGTDLLAETSKDALLNIIKVLAHEVEGAERPDFKGFNTAEAERWHSAIGAILDCLSDKDYVGAEAHLRSKGFLCRIG